MKIKGKPHLFRDHGTWRIAFGHFPVSEERTRKARGWRDTMNGKPEICAEHGWVGAAGYLHGRHYEHDRPLRG